MQYVQGVFQKLLSRCLLTQIAELHSHEYNVHGWSNESATYGSLFKRRDFCVVESNLDKNSLSKSRTQHFSIL